jgi:tRNA wybutosine-synthesizing protein 1
MSDSADPATGSGTSETDDGGTDDTPAQVSSPNYHSENHTAAQTCGWTANALRGEGRC